METIKWHFYTFSSDLAFLSYQNAHPDYPVIFINRLRDGSIFVVFGTVVSPVPGIYHFVDGYTTEQLTTLQTDNPTFVITDVIRRVDGKCAIVYIEPSGGGE